MKTADPVHRRNFGHRILSSLILEHTILLKGTQVEFKDPNECDTFLKSSWWEDSDECGIEIFHRAPLEKKIF